MGEPVVADAVTGGAQVAGQGVAGERMSFGLECVSRGAPGRTRSWT